MTQPDGNKPPLAKVDAIVPVYRERPEAIEATLEACLQQTYPISCIYLVDDCSPVPVRVPQRLLATGRIHPLRLPQNRGISAARNSGIAQSDAPIVACINCEVLPAPDWLETCTTCLLSHPDVGVCYTRMEPSRPERLLTRWRMRFQEDKFGDITGPATFAPGHAALFRREAIDKVGGYTLGMGNNEDWDVCDRIRKVGWETQYIAESRCVSIQEDTFTILAKKQLTRSDWESPADYSVFRFFLIQCKWLLVRMGRNVVKARFYFLPVDVAVWASALWMASSRTLLFLGASGGRARPASLDEGSATARAKEISKVRHGTSGKD